MAECRLIHTGKQAGSREWKRVETHWVMGNSRVIGEAHESMARVGWEPILPVQIMSTSEIDWWGVAWFRREYWPSDRA